MKNQFLYLVFLSFVIYGCASYTIRDNKSFKFIERAKNLELYSYSSEFGNVICALYKGSDKTVLYCFSNVLSLEGLPPIRKKIVFEQIKSAIAEYNPIYEVDTFEDNIAFYEILNKPVDKIPNYILEEKFSNLTNYVLKLDALLQEMKHYNENE